MAPEPSDPAADSVLKEAELARQHQLWDDSVKMLQTAIKQNPSDGRLRLALAQSYEGKARQTGVDSFFLMALQEYWRLVNANPGDVKAVDGLLAAAYNGGQLSEVMEEIRARMAKNPEIDAYKVVFKKIETLFLFSAEPKKAATAGPKGFVHLLASRILPFVSLACFIAWTILRLKSGAQGGSLSANARLLDVALSRFALFSILGYLGYQAFLRIRSSR